MHSIEELGTNVPAFLAKLWKLVEDPGTNDLISWSPGGSSFIIRNQARFARELLPLYYKHNNMASFVRQLNMYGFHKVVSIEAGGLKVDRDDMEFAHHCFLMGSPYLLEHIKRKIPTTKSEESRTGSKPELVSKVLTEVKSLKGRQESVDSKLHAMKRENEVLWREVAILRQKHLKQQQIVNKLIQFLVSMVQSSRSSGLGIKRHYPLMLNDIAHRPKKTAKRNGQLPDRKSVASNMSPTGPVIHELDPTELLEDCIPGADDGTTSTDFLTADLCISVNGEVQSPASSERLEHPSPETLLELAEEYPVSCEMLATSPTSLKTQSRAKDGKVMGVERGKKRRAKAATATSTVTTSVITEEGNMDTEEPINVGNFLEIVMPELMPDADVPNNLDVIDLDVVEVTQIPTENSLLTATDPVLSTLSTDGTDKMSADDDDDDDDLENGPLNNDPVSSAPSGSKPSSTNIPPSNDVIISAVSPNAIRSPSDMTLACASSSTDSSGIKRCGIPEDLDSHVDNTQSELDMLKELLKSDGYSLDANTLLGVCPALLGLETDVLLKLFGDDPMSYGIPMTQDVESGQDKENGVSGSELMAYSSSLLDLSHMFDNSSADDWILPDSNYENADYEKNSSDLNTPQVVLLKSPGFPSVTASNKNKKK